MLQGVNNKKYKSQWMFPGGKVDFKKSGHVDTSAEYGVVREFLEETGLPSFSAISNATHYDHKQGGTCTRVYFARAQSQLNGFNPQAKEIQDLAFPQITGMSFSTRANKTVPISRKKGHLYVIDCVLNSYVHAQKQKNIPNNRLSLFMGASLVKGKLVFPGGHHPDLVQALPQAHWQPKPYTPAPQSGGFVPQFGGGFAQPQAAAAAPAYYPQHHYTGGFGQPQQMSFAQQQYCKCGCGNTVSPPTNGKTYYDTCCWECTQQKGHSNQCYTRNGKTPCGRGCNRPLSYKTLASNAKAGYPKYKDCCHKCKLGTGTHASYCQSC